jgi:hypothetical protein
VAVGCQEAIGNDSAARVYVFAAVVAAVAGHAQQVAHCPGQKPPFSAVKRPAHPYKSPI